VTAIELAKAGRKEVEAIGLEHEELVGGARGRVPRRGRRGDRLAAEIDHRPDMLHGVTDQNRRPTESLRGFNHQI
jgi:hypothetical protein